jgi:hypothetical protein
MPHPFVPKRTERLCATRISRKTEPAKESAEK